MRLLLENALRKRSSRLKRPCQFYQFHDDENMHSKEMVRRNRYARPTSGVGHLRAGIQWVIEPLSFVACLLNSGHAGDLISHGCCRCHCLLANGACDYSNMLSTGTGR